MCSFRGTVNFRIISWIGVPTTEISIFAEANETSHESLVSPIFGHARGCRLLMITLKIARTRTETACNCLPRDRRPASGWRRKRRGPRTGSCAPRTLWRWRRWGAGGAAGSRTGGRGGAGESRDEGGDGGERGD